MASPDVSVSVGYTLASDGANSAWAPKILDVQPPESTVEEIETSDQAMSEDHRTFKAATIGDSGSLTITHYYRADDPPVVGAANETFTLTHPDAETLTFDGFILSHTPEDHSFNGVMMSSTVIRMSGDPA